MTSRNEELAAYLTSQAAGQTDDAGDPITPFVTASMGVQITQLPPEAPVTPLGVNDGQYYYLDAHRQIRRFKARDVSRNNIFSMFGTSTDWVYQLWPTLRKENEELIITGWNGTKAQESMMTAAARKGIWREEDAVRGRGAWKLDDGRLAIHSGPTIYLSDGTSQPPGLIERKVYPADMPAITPTASAVPTVTLAGELLELIETWTWERPFDAVLMFGWVAAALMGGALKVRPLVWVTGENGSGKSTLMGQDGVVHAVLGQGIMMTANSTAPGLWQQERAASLPIAIDEIEAKRGSGKAEAIIELARQAYSGGMILRGGADHQGHQFRAMRPVLFGSILVPQILPQDLSRLALLNLRQFPQGSPEPVIDRERLAATGQAMLHRLLTRWHVWPTMLATWRDYLIRQGHRGRAADQFGTLLAAAEFMLSDQIPDDDRMDQVASLMTPDSLTETRVADSNAERCVAYAMSRQSSSIRSGEVMTVAELITCALRRYGAEMSNPVKSQDAVRYLERSGVSVVGMVREGDGVKVRKVPKMAPADVGRALDDPRAVDREILVAIAPDGDGVLDLFKGSDWEGAPGSHNPYVQALLRVPGARRSDDPLRIGQRTCRAILIPIERCIDVPSAAEASAITGDT